jgi:hypothetical protein
MDERCNLSCQEWWDRISNLDILLCPVAEEEIIVWEGLQPGSFAHRQAAALERVRVDEIVTVFRDVAGNCRRRFVCKLDTEAVVEDAAVPVTVIGAQGGKSAAFGL